jgi:MFS family permease
MASLVKQPSLFPILLVNFVGTLGFSIVLPFLVFLVTKFGGNAIVYGLLAATYPAFQLIGAPVLGRWSDIFGRKKVLLLSNVGTSVGWILFLFALSLPSEKSFSIDIYFLGTFVINIPLLVLFLARAIDGITGGNISIANAYLADLSSDRTRSKNLKNGNIFQPWIYSRPCTSWNFRGNYLWSNIASSSSVNSILGHVNCNIFFIKRI